ncbi:short-chain dehydrogenase/reductase SDR [Burkholderia sp. H160]|nr:short-chain dehydrogenase/reductase SDR [Burkholderia sp. H160]
MTDYRRLFSLENKTILVTGAAGGLGSAVAALFASAGARLIVSDYNETAAQTALANLGTTEAGHRALPFDLADLDGVRQCMLDLVSEGVIPDGLVLNAGMQGPAGSLADVSESDWNQVMAVNLCSAHRITSVLAPAMAQKGGGSITLMASIAALRGNKAIGLYGLTKASLAQLARNLAVEWGPRNIRANAIAPGLIRTPLSRTMMDDPQFMQRRLSLTPLRRVGEPDEIAATALFLACDGGAFVSGQTIVVDGGTVISDGS